MVKLNDSNGLLNEEVKVISTFKIQKPTQDMPKPHIQCLIVGPTGSGKTNMMSNMLSFYQDKKYETRPIFDVMILVSPSSAPQNGFKSESKLDVFKWDEVYNTFNAKTMDKIIENQTKRLKDFIKYEKDLKTYNNLMNEKKIDNKILIDYFSKYPELEKPTSPYDRLCTCVIVFDDVVSANRLPILSDFISKSRHLNCSFFTCIQALTQAGSHLRQNTSVLILLKNNNNKTLDTVLEEFGGSDLTKEEWYQIASMPENKHDFIMIDSKEPDINKKYRLNFDRFITIK